MGVPRVGEHGHIHSLLLEYTSEIEDHDSGGGWSRSISAGVVVRIVGVVFRKKRE